MMLRSWSVRALARSAAARSYGKAAADGTVNNFPTVQTSTLDNLIRVATAETGGKGASVAVFVNAGSAFETGQNNGLSNLLVNVGQCESNAERGVSLTPFASREQIGFVAHSTTGAGAALQSLRNALNAAAEGKNVDAHRERIVRSLGDLTLNDDQVVFDHLHSVAYQGTPLAQPLTGTTASLSQITTSNIADFVKSHFTGGRIVIAGAGNVTHADLVAAAGKVFTGIAGSAEFDFGRLPETDYTGSMVSVRDDDLSRVSAAFAMKGVSNTDADYFTFKVIEKIVGQWNRQYNTSLVSSVPFVNRVQAEGANTASALRAFSFNYHTTGLFGVLADTTRDTIEDLSFNVFNEFNRVANAVTATEVDRAKAKVARELLAVPFANSHALASDVGLQLARIGRYMSPAEVSARISEVSKADVQRVATKYLTDECPAIAATGPTIYLPDYNQMRGWTYWNRL